MGVKISDLTAKGSKIASTDIVEVSVDTGLSFVSRKVTGSELNELSLDTSPQLGGNLDVNSNKITSASNGNIKIEPNGTGAVLIGGNDNQPSELRFMELLSNGSSYVGFKAPNDIITSRVYTLPTADGTNGQVLSTNGTGTLSWATAGGGGGLTIGTTAIGSGTDGRVLFQAGGVLQQDASFFWDNTNKRLGIGATPASTVRLDVRAQGALSTDIAFRVRNSADTGDLISFRGDGSEWIQSVPFRHAGTLTGGTNTAQSLYLGYNSRGLASSGFRNVIIGTGAGSVISTNDSVCIGHNASAFNTSIAIGSNATASVNNFCVMGSESYPFSAMSIGTGGTVTSLAAVQNMIFSVGGVAGGFTSNSDLSSKFFRIQSQGGSGTGNSAPIQFSVAPSGASGFTANTFVIPFEVRGDAAGLNHYQLSTPRVPSASITDGYIQYSADITAGNAAPHFRTENGNVIKIYRETTAVVAAALVGGGGTTITATDTFDGYTLQQIVKALRNTGLLA